MSAECFFHSFSMKTVSLGSLFLLTILVKNLIMEVTYWLRYVFDVSSKIKLKYCHPRLHLIELFVVLHQVVEAFTYLPNEG